MQSSVNEPPAGHRDVAIRIGSIRDLDLLIQIDNDASVLFEHAGLQIDSQSDLAVENAERERWARCLSVGCVQIAVSHSGQDVGFAALGLRDGEPFLDQLSVRMSAMRHGIGTRLLYGSIRMAQQAGGRAIWLTTYDHLSWNRPYYERHGFARVAPEECGEELVHELLFERRFLPCPQERVVMRRDLATTL